MDFIISIQEIRFWPILETLFDTKLENITKQQVFLKEKKYRPLGCASKLQD